MYSNFKVGESDVPTQRRHHGCRASTAALPPTRCYEAGHVVRIDATEGQALWQPGGAEEDSCFREGDRRLRLVHDDTVLVSHPGLQLSSAEVLRGLRNFLNMDRPEHHSIDRLKERGVEKGSGRHCSPRSGERSVFNQTNIGTFRGQPWGDC